MKPLRPFQAHNGEVVSHNALSQLIKHTLDYRISGGLYSMCLQNRSALYLSYITLQKVELTGLHP